MAEEIPNVIAVKEASGNLAQIMEIARGKPKHFSLLSGDDAFTLPIMALGGDGCISVVANETPREFSEMIRQSLNGNWKKARALHNKLLPLMNINFVEANPIPVKAADLRNALEGQTRKPAAPGRTAGFAPGNQVSMSPYSPARVR